ncbi:MAG: hypothetical protein FWC11_00305 [Firmicutes bacterium]|nr:hypothetical protein [Bacillota bacterium]
MSNIENEKTEEKMKKESSAKTQKQLANMISVEGSVKLEWVENFRTRKETEEVIITIKHPFDEFGDEVTLSIRENSRRGRFNYRVKERLRDSEERSIPVKCDIYLAEYMSKKSRKMLTYLDMNLHSPFGDALEFVHVRNEEKRAELLMCGRENLKVLTQKEFRDLRNSQIQKQ